MPTLYIVYYFFLPNLHLIIRPIYVIRTASEPSLCCELTLPAYNDAGGISHSE